MRSVQRVQQARGEIVAQQGDRQVKRRAVRRLRVRSIESMDGDLDRERGLDPDLRRAVDHGLRDDRPLRLLAARDPAEGALEQGHDRGGVEVARQDQAHVAANIVFVIERLHLPEAGILQALGGADDVVGIRRAGEELLSQLNHSRSGRVVVRPVLLFVDGIQLALEEAEDRMQQAVAVELGPLREELRREEVVVVGKIRVGGGVEPRAADLGGQAFELIGDGILGGLDVQAVDLLLDGLALRRVDGGGQAVVADFDGVQPDLLRFVVRRAQLGRALEEHVFEVVRDAGARAVPRACPDDDGAIRDRTGVVFVEPHLHAVGKGDFFDVPGFVLGLKPEGREQPGQKENPTFHSIGSKKCLLTPQGAAWRI